jgi:uncharacterized membrane protein
MKQKIAFALIMGMITTAVISFVLISINIGFSDKFLIAWLRSWSVAYVLAVSLVLLVAPRVQLLVNYFLKEKPVSDRNDK